METGSPSLPTRAGHRQPPKPKLARDGVSLTMAMGVFWPLPIAR